MAEWRSAVAGLLAVLDAALVRAASAATDAAAAADLGRFAALVRAVATEGQPREPVPPAVRLPVCRFWDAALDHAATGAAAALVPGLRALGGRLHWTQNPNYRRRPPDGAFLDRYGYAVLVGPSDSAPGLVVDGRLALGVLLLGPGTHYPLHHHPAVEVYCPLSGDGEWWRGAGPWRREPAGALIYHAPHVPHATRTGAGPLLAVYLWQGDLATDARLLTVE